MAIGCTLQGEHPATTKANRDSSNRRLDGPSLPSVPGVFEHLHYYPQQCIYTAVNIVMLQTLSDPTRLRIVEVLAGGERSVGDLVSEVEIAQSGVSRHLRILKNAGFVHTRPDGQRRLYSLLPEPFQELDDWLRRFRAIWEDRLDRLDDALLLQRSRGE